MCVLGGGGGMGYESVQSLKAASHIPLLRQLGRSTQHIPRTPLIGKEVVLAGAGHEAGSGPRDMPMFTQGPHPRTTRPPFPNNSMPTPRTCP